MLSAKLWQIKYPRMSMFSGRKWWMHHASYMQASQATNKPTGMRAHHSPPMFLQSVCEDSGHNQGKSKLMVQAAWLQWASTQGCQYLSHTKNVDAWWGHTWWLVACWTKLKCTQTPTKRCCSPTVAVLVGSWQQSQAQLRYHGTSTRGGCRWHWLRLMLYNSWRK